MSEPALRIHTSNRLDVLVERLAEDLGREPSPPFEPEVFVVQSQGMERWLTLELARRWGIAAGLVMLFPKTFYRRLIEESEEASDGGLRRLELDRAAPSAFAREIMTWRLFDLLGREEIRRDSLWSEHLAAFLDDDHDQRKRYQLAARLADLFDDYQVYRPEMLTGGWEVRSSGEEDVARSRDTAVWQAMLWEKLVAEADEVPPAVGLLSAIAVLQGDAGGPLAGAVRQRLPRRLTVFGISVLPPVFLRLLAGVSRSIPVTIYFVSPTYHFWGDLRSEREAERLKRRWRRDPADPGIEELHFEEGHPLLAAFGRQGRDFFNLLQEIDASGNAWHELDFVPPESDSVLHAVQSDILHLIDRGAGDPEHSPYEIARGDDSLRVHVCHSPMREMEVLRDLLLDALKRDKELRPSEILVLVPDIRVYGPYVQAVFGAAASGDDKEPVLPFSIADRRIGEERPTADTVLQLLDLVTGRLDPGSVLDLLEVGAVRRAADLAAHEISRLRQWIDDTRIRWGMDGRQRSEAFGLPAEDGNTWRAGMDRLVMGYAAGDRQELVGGVLPYAGATVSEIELLGRWTVFLERLFRELRALREPRTLRAWAEAIDQALEVLYEAETDDELQGLLLVRRVFDELRQVQRFGPRETRPQADGGEGLVTLEVVRAHFRGRLADDGFGRGFLSGGITFCALKPMRTLPFKVICVAGLDDGAFPRRDPPRSFDLIAAAPRLGDRSLRDDDRYLFLETLMAVRSRLILSYVGRSQRDHDELPPSVVVSELLDHLERSCVVAGGGSVREALVIEHRLQPWSAAYFEGETSRLSSFSGEDFEACLALAGSPAPEAPFIAGSSPLGEDAIHLDLHDLREFWVNPSRTYCNKVLGLSLRDMRPALDDSEPFGVDALAGYGMQSWLLREHLRAPEEAVPERLEILRARGELPAAGLGAAAFSGLERAVRGFVESLPGHRPMEPVSIQLQGAGWRLEGQLDGLTDGGLLRFRPARLKPKDLIRAWIEHVAWCAWRSSGPPPRRTPSETSVHGTDRAVRFPFLEGARFYLEALVAGYRKGLERPLPLFEQTSYRFADQLRQMADPRSRRRQSPLDAAREGWQGGRFVTGDSEDPYVALCCRGRDPLGEASFAVWAEYLWGPIFDAMEDL